MFGSGLVESAHDCVCDDFSEHTWLHVFDQLLCHHQRWAASFIFGSVIVQMLPEKYELLYTVGPDRATLMHSAQDAAVGVCCSRHGMLQVAPVAGGGFGGGHDWALAVPPPVFCAAALLRLTRAPRRHTARHVEMPALSPTDPITTFEFACLRDVPSFGHVSYPSPVQSAYMCAGGRWIKEAPQQRRAVPFCQGTPTPHQMCYGPPILDTLLWCSSGGMQVLLTLYIGQLGQTHAWTTLK